MKASLSRLCEIFISNRYIIKAEFKWESAYIYPVSAAIFTDKGQRADIERLRTCRDMLKQQTGVFSNFRGTGRLAMISMLAVDSNPQGKLDQSLQVYNLLKEYFFSSAYLPVASMIITGLAKPDQYDQIAARTRLIYNLMKKHHPLLTSGEDSVYAALLALSDLSNEQVVSEAEQCYSILKNRFKTRNAIQSLSHVLALGKGSADLKCQKVISMYDGLRARGYKYGTSYELATLGVLALLPDDMSSVMMDIIDADNYLSGQKGYGFFGLGKKQRLMHAGMLVSSDYIGQSDNVLMKSAALGGTISLIAAQQAAICAAIAASSAASAGAASS